MTIQTTDLRNEINQAAQDDAARMTKQMTDTLRDDQTSFGLIARRGLKPGAPSLADHVKTDLNERLANGAQDVRTYGLAILSYLCHAEAPSVTPAVHSEVLGTQIKLIVSVGPAWVGTVTTWSVSEQGCIINDNLVVGSSVELNGALVGKHLCSDPAHKLAATEARS